MTMLNMMSMWYFLLPGSCPVSDHVFVSCTLEGSLARDGLRTSVAHAPPKQEKKDRLSFLPNFATLQVALIRMERVLVHIKLDTVCEFEPDREHTIWR